MALFEPKGGAIQGHQIMSNRKNEFLPTKAKELDFRPGRERGTKFGVNEIMLKKKRFVRTKTTRRRKLPQSLKKRGVRISSEESPEK